MNAERLLELFDRVSDAPDAIPRLRRFVLHLAVRGKLVEQDPGDEPAVERLSVARRNLKAMAEVARRVRWKPTEPVLVDEVDREIPSGWVAARVNDTALYVNGLAFKPSDWKPAGVPIIRIQNLTDGTKEFNYAVGNFPDEITVRDGDLLVSWSATLEAFQWDRGEGVLNQHIFRVIPDDSLTDREYLLLLLRSAIREMADSEHAHGLVMTHINRGPFLNHVVLIPPLSEQRRIVARAEELMALIGSLEVARTEREATRGRLTCASLARLTDPGDTEAFPAHAGFVIGALPTLAARIDQIKSLRQAILGMAVRGELIRGVGGETATVGKYRKLQNGYAFRSEWFVPSGVRLLRNVNVGHGEIVWGKTAHLPDDRVEQYERFSLSAGDIVLSLDRPFISSGTKVARIRSVDVPALLLQRVGRFIETDGGLLDDYLFLWINSPHFNEQIDPGRSNGVPHVSSRQVEAAEIFVPALQDQSLIVEKVNILMGLCERLEAALAAADRTKQRLLGAVLQEALLDTAYLEEAA